MASKRWISTAILAASSAALPPVVLRAQVPNAPVPTVAPTADVPANPQALVDRELATLGQQLIGPTPAIPAGEAPQQQRDEAARRLMSRGSPAALRLLLDALSNPGLPQDATARREARLAVARAVAHEPDPDPRFIGPLANLVGTDPSATDAAALALAQYPTDPTARARLIATAQNVALPAAIRRGAIRALGNVVNREAADALIALLADPRQLPAISDASVKALTDLTGQSFGHNAAAWQQWQAAKPAIAWQQEVQMARGRRLANADRANGEFINDLKLMQAEIYQRSDKNGKFLIVMRYLNSTAPQARVMGARLVKDEHEAANPSPPLANKRLEELVGDSDPDVRLNVALAINSVNDTDALDAILTQLSQEKVPDIKIAQIDALVPMRKLRAMPVLRLLLRDPSIAVATKSAEAIQRLGPQLMKEDPVAAGTLADELWQLGKQRSAEPGGADFRRAAIEALASLHYRRLANELLALRGDPDPRIRSAALRALAELGDRATFFVISQWLAAENSPAVRLDAIDALAATGSFEDASDMLNRYMRPNTEPDKAVQERAWFQFQSLLGRATSAQVLNRWASDFQNEPYHRLPVLLKLNENLQAAMLWQDLASSRQNTGVTYMELRDPARAAIQFAQALDYWQKQRVPNPVTVTLIRQLLQALLAAKDYAKVKDFAGRQITINPGIQDIFGPDIKQEVNRLYDVGVNDKDPQKLRDALSLIDNALKIQPPLAERFQNDLRQFQEQVQRAMPK